MSERPNVLFIITDDQGYGDIAYQGNPYLQTPQLDQMARESVQLDNHHHDPLCSPSRAALLTGQYACRNGVWHVIHGRHLLHPDAVTMAEIFAENGYRTAMFGKWHLGDNYPFAPRFRGFDQVLCHRGGGVGELPDFWGNNYVDDCYFRNGEPERCRGYCTDVFFSAALDFVEADAEAPFFVYLAPNAMHGPHIVPEGYAAPYLAQGLPEERAKFYGMIANFDENIGRLFQRLKELGQDENTIVIFTADHGTAAGFDPETGEGYNAGLRGKKGEIYDGGHQVNFFLRWKHHLPEEKKISQLTAHIDILPTLAELCGLNCPADLEFDGCSLAPLVRGDAPSLPDRSVIIQLQTDAALKWHHTAVLNGPWRLLNDAELYNVETDRGQRQNVAAAHPDILSRLRRDYEHWWRSMAEAFSQVIAIPVGAAHESTTVLSARDWHPVSGRVPWRQSWIDDLIYDANGSWIIDVAEAGSYEFELRSHPRESLRPLVAEAAELRIDQTAYRQNLAPDARAASFIVELPAGRMSLQTALCADAEQRSRGAYYVYVTKVQNQAG